ncbi:MAG: MmcQ/YjbR family DNA-binding protein [Ignavibacteriales bacterium]|nr:MmcQ/YjbR family DNA-binding protein [Ignavibacteriales bacterium]
MVSQKTFIQLATSFPDVEMLPHFDMQSFRVKKKIFVTLNEKENRCCVKLPPIEQSVFCSFDTGVIWPVPNKWGTQGWTLINLQKVRKATLHDALQTAYTHVSKKDRKK